MFLGAVCLLFISSSVTMAVPFSLGKILDIIYTNTDDREEAQRQLNKVGGVLVIMFVLGALCNFGRIYIMSASGILPYSTFSMTYRLFTQATE